MGLGTDSCFLSPDLCQAFPGVPGEPGAPARCPAVGDSGCAGGDRAPWRRLHWGPWAQTESCNWGLAQVMAPALEEREEGPGMWPLDWWGLLPVHWRCPWKAGDSRHPVPDSDLLVCRRLRGPEHSAAHPDCANQCPGCIDLWDRVECLQGPMSPR